MALPGEQSPPTERIDPAERERALVSFVTRRVISLQHGYLSDTSAATKALAELRRPAPDDGPALSLWLNVLNDLPESLIGRTDEPSRAERAALASLRMYAVHQQSRATAMHVSGRGVGTAIRALAVTSGNESAVLRRFHALGSAEYWTGTVSHLRGLIGQLRAASEPLDYGRLARDLYRLQHPVLAPSVRLDWARQYHRTQHSPQARTEAIEPQSENGAVSA